jgi:hypothetical protein
MMIRRYPGILTEYEVQLENRVQAGHITAKTKRTRLNRANRLFEALIVALTQEEMEAYVLARGFRASYGGIIRDLKTIAEARERRG